MRALAAAAPVFDAEAFLSASGPSTKAATFKRAAPIYVQGNPADSVLYVQQGTVLVLGPGGSGKEAVVGVIGPGDFFGEGALAGQPVRLGTATAMTASTILVVPLAQMKRLLLEQHPLSERFLAHMLARNSRLEADLVDQLFNDSEKRLARTLLLLARYGKPDMDLGTCCPDCHRKCWRRSSARRARGSTSS